MKTYPRMRYEFLEEDSFQLKYLFSFTQDYAADHPPKQPHRWNSAEVRSWLIQEFGEPGSDNTREYRYTHWGRDDPHMSVLFRDAADAAAFKLRFG